MIGEWTYVFRCFQGTERIGLEPGQAGRSAARPATYDNPGRHVAARRLEFSWKPR